MTEFTELAQREKFEAWWERAQHNGNPPRFGWSHWRDGEGYKVDGDDSELDVMWEVWKAARAELENPDGRIVAGIKADGVEEFAAYISLYNSNAEHHALNFAKQLREDADK